MKKKKKQERSEMFNNNNNKYKTHIFDLHFFFLLLNTDVAVFYVGCDYNSYKMVSIDFLKGRKGTLKFR